MDGWIDGWMDDDDDDDVLFIHSYLLQAGLLSVRLVGGDDNNRGCLQVLHNGVWGTVCDDFFNDAAARVVCNMLGFGYNNCVLCAAAKLIPMSK